MKKIKNYDDVIEFWFHKLTKSDWFKKSEDLDSEIKSFFLSTLESAKQGELYHWRTNPMGRLAEIIVLDQFSRNIYRDKPQAFEADALALVLAQEAVFNKVDHKLETSQKAFMYMPFMHSESLVIHEQAVLLFSQKGLEYNLDYELRHKRIIEKFGRYPHRNKILNRNSTSEEIEFLKTAGSSF